MVSGSHWLVPCLLSILLGFPADINLRSRAEDLPEKLGAEDISIGEPLQIPLHSDKESVSVEKELVLKDFDSSSPEEVSPPEQKPKKTQTEINKQKSEPNRQQYYQTKKEITTTIRKTRMG